MTAPTLHLLRGVDTTREMLGALVTPKGTRICWTLERPWMDNAVGQSCIPSGTYEVTETMSHRFAKLLYEVHDVPERTGIRIHPANWHHELSGCIAPGMDWGYLSDELAVVRSRDAYAQLRSFAGPRFTMRVSNFPGTTPRPVAA